MLPRCPAVLAAALLVVPVAPAGASRPELRCVGSAPLVVQGEARCVHTDWAGMPERAAPAAPPSARLRCYGDGTTGPRVQLVYGYVEGRRNRSASVVPWIRSAVAPRMQAVVGASAKGHDLGIRFLQAPGCGPLDVQVVRLPPAAGRGDPMDRFRLLIDRLQELGLDRTDRKYQVVLDDATEDGVCGLGEVLPEEDQQRPANAHDGVPTLGARTDVTHELGIGASLGSVPRYSAVWHHTNGRTVDCWAQGRSSVLVMLHELFHTLGAVQLSAPHSDGGAHCSDTPSVMCPVVGKPTVLACAGSRTEVLDCGDDDYWDPAPAAGSYLDSHANVAESAFFGPRPQDDLAASPL